MTKNPDFPKLYGVLAGYSFKDDKTEQYIGHGATGYFSSKACIIQTTAEPGCHIDYMDEMITSTKDTFYLVSHPNLTWIATDDEKVFKIPDVIRYTTENMGFNFMYGRVKIGGFYRMGIVETTYPSLEGYYFSLITPAGKKWLNEFEVLSCSSKSELTCGNVVKYNEINLLIN